MLGSERQVLEVVNVKEEEGKYGLDLRAMAAVCPRNVWHIPSYTSLTFFSLYVIYVPQYSPRYYPHMVMLQT